MVTSRERVCDGETVYINYPGLTKHILKGQRIFLNDGEVQLKVEGVNATGRSLQCRVLNTGSYSSHKGVNFPDSDLPFPSLTRKDKEDLKFALDQDVEFIALSFVRRAADIKSLGSIVNRAGKTVKCLAKIEKPEAIENFKGILEASDGIMIARGDLGIETNPSKMPVIQKDCIAKANLAGKLVIVATQMLESMMHNPRSTRAETTDVANAILDGTDAVMLSGETAAGDYPVQAVETMTRIARETEASSYYSKEFVNLSLAEKHPPHAIFEAAEWASRDLGDAPVMVFTASGDTALYLSKVRNQAPIYAFSPNPHVVRMLSLAWNITPFQLGIEKDIVKLQDKAEEILLKERMVRKGQLVVSVSGTSTARGATNMLKVKRVGEE
jgi:pyruvate kinase